MTTQSDAEMHASYHPLATFSAHLFSHVSSRRRYCLRDNFHSETSSFLRPSLVKRKKYEFMHTHFTHITHTYIHKKHTRKHTLTRSYIYMDSWTNGRTDGQTDGRMDVRTYGMMDGWMGGWLKVRSLVFII